MTKDSLSVNSWNYTFTNWVYVVLSRVCTLAGLFLCKKLDENRSFLVDEDLLQEEEHLARLEESFLHNVEFTHWDEVNSAS